MKNVKGAGFLGVGCWVDGGIVGEAGLRERDCLVAARACARMEEFT